MDAVDIATLLGDWANTRGPLYQRLATSLRDAIRKGDVGGFIRLPSERDFARHLGVSRTTVIAAYSLLREEGLVETQRGSGTRVANLPGAVFPSGDGVASGLKLLGEVPEGVIDCAGSVITDLGGLESEVLQVTQSDVRRLAQSFTYEPLGLPMLREELASYYSRTGLETNPDEVLITTGAQQAIHLLFSLFARTAGTIAVEDPTYLGALEAARVAGASVVGVPIDEEGVKPRDLVTVLRSAPIGLVYVMTGCHNPTGAVMSVARRQEIARITEAAGVPVVDDRTLADLVLADRSSGFLGDPASDSIITIGSFSKLFWPGLRIGWIRASSLLIRRIARAKIVADLGSAHSSQLLATRVLSKIDDVREKRRAQLKERLELFSGLLQERLPDWSFSRPQGGPFLWIRLPHGDADRFTNLALRYGVRVLSGRKLSARDMFSDRLRISYVADPTQLQTAVQRLEAAWAVFGSTAETGRAGLHVVV